MFRLMYRHARLLACVATVIFPACHDASSPVAPATPPPEVRPSPSRLVPLAGGGQIAAPGTSLPGLLLVEAVTATGRPSPGVGVVFTVTEGGGTIAGDTVFTDAFGEARSGPWVLGTTGPQTVAARAGGVTANFTATALAPDLTPLTSPDSSGPPTGNVSGRLAFVRGDTAFVSNIDANTATVLRSLPPRAHAPGMTALSPDRSLIAFVNDASTDICLASVEAGTEIRCAGLGYHDLTGLAWSPDGRRLAFIGPVDVERVDGPFPDPSDLRDAFVLDATTIGRVTPSPVYALLDYVSDLAWSPDGQKLALAVPGKGIYTINADGSARQPIYYRSDVRDITGVRWSPDGQALALTLRLMPCDGFCDVGIATVRLDGTGFRLLTRARESAGLYVLLSSWSPDGTAFAYGVVDCRRDSNACREDVKVVGAAGGSSRLLLSNAELLGWWP
jgi:hypothetical protein